MAQSDAYLDQLKGNYSVVQGKMKQEYADLTDDDLLYEDGKEDEWFGRIQAKLGKTRAEIHEWFDRNF